MKVTLIQDPNACCDGLYPMLKQLSDIDITIQQGMDTEALLGMPLPDIVIIDASTHHKEALTCVLPIKQAFPSVKVFFVINAEAAPLAHAAIEAHADAVVYNTLTLDELKELIRYTQRNYRIFSDL